MEYFKSETLQPDLNHIKWNVFQRAAGTYLMETDRPTLGACWRHLFTMVKGTLHFFVTYKIFAALDVTALTRQVFGRLGRYWSPKNLWVMEK